MNMCMERLRVTVLRVLFLVLVLAGIALLFALPPAGLQPRDSCENSKVEGSIRQMKKVPVGMPVGALAFLPSGKKIVAASTEERIGIWDWESGKRLFATEGYGSNGLAVSPNGALVVSGCRDGGLKIWKVSSDGILSDMAGLTRGSVGPMTFCGNKRTVIYATRDVISWDFEKHTVKVLYSPKDRNFAINALGCSLDGNMAAVGFANGQIVIWDIAANKQAGRIIESCSDSKELRSIKCIAFSSQNDVFATGGIDHTVRLWNAASG